MTGGAPALFITGASGFIGRQLLARLAGRYARVTALSRTSQPPVPGVTWVQGGIADKGAWSRHLGPDTDVAHLAAATGGASASAHRAVNAVGTETLVRAAEQAGVRGFLLVSSIAVRFPEDAFYPYATAKREAEAIVRGARVPSVIVRPTIVLGPGSPIGQRLAALAGGPMIAAIGGGTARVQPVDVTDVAAALATLLERRAVDGGTVEFGGPEVLTMRDLLVRTRAALGKPPARVVSLPYGMLRAGLIGAGALLGPRAPVTPGQLTSFVHDGVAQPNQLWEEMRARLVAVDRMFRNA